MSPASIMETSLLMRSARVCWRDKRVDKSITNVIAILKHLSFIRFHWINRRDEFRESTIIILKIHVPDRMQ